MSGISRGSLQGMNHRFHQWLRGKMSHGTQRGLENENGAAIVNTDRMQNAGSGSVAALLASTFSFSFFFILAAAAAGAAAFASLVQMKNCWHIHKKPTDFLQQCQVFLLPLFK
ncbi:hypothetical protein SLE2022_261280 [Rubroshorea leprosula]